MDRLIYRSRARWPAPEVALDGILDASLVNNPRLGITGALGFSGGTYVQLLEGPGASLDALLRQLAADPRHGGIDILVRARVAGRLVPDWTMARVDLADIAPLAEERIEARDGPGLTALLANLSHRGVSSMR